MPDRDRYENPLNSRYASPEMSHLWSPLKKFRTWRRLWIALAEAEQELGLPISDEQLDELRAAQDDIDFPAAEAHERRLRHDVMAHVSAYKDVCPQAGGIIHWGATSCFVTDNADVLLLRESLELICRRTAAVIDHLGAFAAKHRDLPCLGMTHLQPAQPTTVGKRACLWAYDLALDLWELEHRLQQLRARSIKGATGTQASFLKLFDGDHDKVRQLEQRVAEKMGFEASYAVTGQTYPRKIDSQILDALSGVAQSAHKMAADLRILASRREWEEPFEEKQIGSSAMPYKRNPMRCERICSLARYAISLQSSPPQTLAGQWMERTLDDSANRRLVLPQAFLAVDAVLVLYQNVAQGMRVYPKMLEKNLRDELPFLASENLMMAQVAEGGDRQELHEVIRQHSVAAVTAMKTEGSHNDLLERLSQDEAFPESVLAEKLDAAKLVGRAPQQVDEFVAEVVEPIRQKYRETPKLEAEVTV